MRKVLKWIGIVLLILAGLIGLVAIISSIVANSRLNSTYDVRAEAITIPDDAAAIARGSYLANTICSDCHGAGLVGEGMIEDAAIATIFAPNITPSEAGVGHFSDADYVRAIRHAVNPDGQGYMIMPAEVFINWSEEDLGATIAFLKTLPPSDHVVPQRSLGPMGKILFSAGMFGDIMPAAYIDHDLPFAAMPEIGQTAEYGGYMAQAFYCTMCHGADMRGGPSPANQPDLGEIPSTIEAAGWSTEQFLTTLTTGVTPDGRQLNPEAMPWESIAKVSDQDLIAIHLYLQELAAQ